MKKMFCSGLLAGFFLCSSAYAADYVIDSEKAHAFISFKIQHLGYSWIKGRFNSFEGNFSYDPEKPQEAKVEVTIDATSIDTNYEKRDEHLRSSDFLNIDAFSQAHFIDESLQLQDDGTYLLQGQFTLHGVTNPLTIKVDKVGEGNDPWGGYRAGFEGETHFTIADYGMDVTRLGPSSQQVYLTLSIEGIRQ
ncbi:MAG: YceI family protein [Gammaproteobacteria bacterium]|nr:YceI family protein [Gammaproteobacteria bacterium]